VFFNKPYSPAVVAATLKALLVESYDEERR
jgi:hypothetical protein